MERKTAILVVEDEASIRTGICDMLGFHGYETNGVATGEDGLRCALDGGYALVVLDVMLPGLSGFDVCRALRAARPEQAILMLTARGSEEDVVTGFRSGADDYVTKPFSVAELLARIEALLRRAVRLAATDDGPFDVGAWRVDPASGRAQAGEVAVDLSRREVALLALFARERGRIVSRRTLLAQVWELRHVDQIQTRTVDMHVAKLRKKLGWSEDGPLQTVRGEGYRYT